jgi:HlyD family secretion protein
MKRGVKWSLAAVLVLAVAGGAAWWQSRQSGQDQPSRFRTTAVDRGPITQVVLASGTLQPVSSINVGTQVSGTVAERLVDFNDRVRAGQVLLRLDDSALAARLRQARAQLAAAQANLALARATFERNERLVAQNFISALALDQSRRELDAASANVDAARAQVSSAETDVANTVIRSPIDGIVLRRNTDVGQTVAASFQTPDLFQLARDLTDMRIHTSVSEADVGLIRPGQAVRFTVDAFPDREFDGTVEQFRLNAATNQGVVTYTILVAVKNPDELLKPGMTAQTRIVVASRPDVLRLPTAALRFQPEDDELRPRGAKKPARGAAAASAASAASAADTARADDDGALPPRQGDRRLYRVWVLGPDDVPQPRQVTVGIANNRFTELVSGPLAAGEVVITRRARAAED